MGQYLAEMFGFSLLLTMAVELAMAFLFRRLWVGGKAVESAMTGTRVALFVHPGRVLALVMLVNLLTNPAAVLLCWLGKVYLPQVLEWPVQLAVEAGVIAVEAYVYRCFAGKSGWRIGRPVAFAVTANLCSWLLGILVAVLRSQAWFRLLLFWLKSRFQ